MMKLFAPSLLLAASACPVPGTEGASPADASAGAVLIDTSHPPAAGFDAEGIAALVEQNVGERLGSEVLATARSARSSVMVLYHEGLPRPPVQQPDGSWRHPPPPANALVRTGAGWVGWSGARQQPVTAAKAVELDRILADPAFWAEAAYHPPDCTDAGAQRMVVRQAGRRAVRHQSCSGSGLTRRLFELTFGGPG